MADMFGDAALFSEFEKERAPSDAILMTKFEENQQDSQKVQLRYKEQSSNGVNFSLGEHESDSSSDSSDSEDGLANETSGNTLAESFKKDSTFSELKRELQQVKQNIQRIKRRCRLIDPNKYSEEKEGPNIQVVYMNNDFARKYKDDIEQFVYGLYQKEKRDSRQSIYQMPPSLTLRPNAVILADDKLQNPQDKIRLINSSTVVGCSQIYRDFIIDSMGSSLVQYNPSLSDGWNIPKYNQVYKEALPVEEETEEEISLICERPPRRPKASCFNCGGDHQLNSCPEQRDFQRIKANREIFQANKSSAPSGNRYHIETDPKFEKFKAGEISKELRDAMGITDQQLPPYIYQMRVIGYPPGHLEEARELKSGLSMFDRYGNEMKDEDETEEDGEVKDGLDTPELSFDIAKIIEYPGFNVPVPKGVRDECRDFGASPMMPHHSKSVLGNYNAYHAEKNARKRQNSDGVSPVATKKRRSQPEPVDMDLDSSGEGSQSPLMTTSGVDVTNVEQLPILLSAPLPQLYVAPYMYMGIVHLHPHTIAEEFLHAQLRLQERLSQPPPPPPPTPTPSDILPFSCTFTDIPPPPSYPCPPFTPPSSCIHTHTITLSSPLSPLSPPLPCEVPPCHTSTFSAPSTPPLPSSPPPLPPLPPPESPQSSPPLPGSPEPQSLETYSTPMEIPLEKYQESFISTEDPSSNIIHKPLCATQLYSPSSNPPSPACQGLKLPLPQLEMGPEATEDENEKNAKVGAETPSRGPVMPSSPFKTPRTPMRLPAPKSGGNPEEGPPLPEATPPRPPPLPQGTPPPTPPTEGILTTSTAQTPTGQSTNFLQKTPSSGGSLSLSFGTPILDGSDSIKDKGLPDPSKFKHGISDHMLFENLPESTGRYEKMRKVMSKLRNKLEKS